MYTSGRTRPQSDHTCLPPTNFSRMNAARSSFDIRENRRRRSKSGGANSTRVSSARARQALREERAPQRAAARAKRGTHGKFAFTADRPGQNQVRHVRTRNDEHHRRCRHEHEEDGLRG